MVNYFIMFLSNLLVRFHCRVAAYLAAKTLVINKPLFIITITLLIPTYTWAQTPTETSAAISEKTTEAADKTANNNTEEPVIEDGKTAEKVIGKPERLPSHLPRTTFPHSEQERMKVLENNLQFQKVEWLQSQKEPFLAIWQEDRSGNAKGAILIIHAEGEHPSWPQTTQPLHDTLPNYGWATMAIHLPDPYTPKAPIRTLATKTIPLLPLQKKQSNEDNMNESMEKKPEETMNPTNEQATSSSSSEKIIGNLSEEDMIKANEKATKDAEKTSTSIEEESEQRLAAAIQFLHSKGQFNIALMGSGVGALRNHQFIKSIIPVSEDGDLEKKIERPIRASIIFNARNQHPFSKETYNEWFFDPEMPVLDIYNDTIRNRQEARTRKKLSKKKKAVTHSQIKLSELSYETTWGENRLSRRVRSFLDAYVQGAEVNNAKMRKGQP